MPMPNSDLPATHAEAVTPSDSTLYDPPTRWVYVGGTGDVAVLLEEDSSPVTLKAVPVGTQLRIRARKIMSTNTTATFIVAMR